MGSEQKSGENSQSVYKVLAVVSPGEVEIFLVLAALSLSFSVNRKCDKLYSYLLCNMILK